MTFAEWKEQYVSRHGDKPKIFALEEWFAKDAYEAAAVAMKERCAKVAEEEADLVVGVDATIQARIAAAIRELPDD